MTNEELNELVKQHIDWPYDPAVHNLGQRKAAPTQEEIAGITTKEKEEFFNSPDFQWPYNSEDRRKAGLHIKPLKQTNVNTSESRRYHSKKEYNLNTAKVEDWVDESYRFTHTAFDDSSSTFDCNDYSSSDCSSYDSSSDCGCDY
jgi:hypothetical protein